MARKNDATAKAGQRGRALVNRDILRLVDADPHGTGMSAQVVRLMGREESGRERWSAPFLVSRSYLWNEAQLGYAVTFHAAEGRTVDSAISVFSGEEDRQATYVPLSRGRENNEAYVIAGWRIADPTPGPRPAPELARQERLDREHAGLGGAQQARPAREGITAEQVLAQCLGRDGQQLSATDTRAAEWSDADRLDVLGVQWQHVTRDAAEHRYQAAVRAALTEEEARQVLADPAATWLWRTLREAEAAGAGRRGRGPPRRGVRAVHRRRFGRPGAGLADPPAHRRDARPGYRFVDQPGPADRRPGHRPVRGRARRGDDRPAAAAGRARGRAPARVGARARAGSGASAGPRRRGSTRPGRSRPTGRCGAGRTRPSRSARGPGRTPPRLRGSWQAAAEALGRQPGDLSGHSDGQLWAWRSAFAREMAWAPPYQGEELAMVRGEIRRAQIDADRARRDAQAAGTDEARQRLAERAAVAERWEQMTRDVADRLAEAQAGYDAWEAATGPTRDRAVAADAELRRRYPDAVIEPLRAQPRSQPEPVSAGPAAEPAAVRRSGPGGCGGSRARAEPGQFGCCSRLSRMDLVAERLREISARLDEADMRAARQAREKAAEISSLYLDPDDPDGAPTPAWQSDLRARQRESVRHEPLPRVPAARAIEAEAGLRDREAAD